MEIFVWVRFPMAIKIFNFLHQVYRYNLKDIQLVEVYKDQSLM